MEVKTLNITITEKNSSACIPSGEYFFFQHNLADQIFGCSVDQVTHSEVVLFTSRDFEVTDLFAHGFSSLGTPLCVAEGVAILGRFVVQCLDYCPTDRVFNCRCLHPL